MDLDLACEPGHDLAPNISGEASPSLEAVSGVGGMKVGDLEETVEQ